MHISLITAAIDFSSMYVWFSCFTPFDVTLRQLFLSNLSNQRPYVRIRHEIPSRTPREKVYT